MRLRRADPESRGVRRQRRGRGFRYLDASGEPVTDGGLIERIEGLVIPPAWRKVWICPDELASILLGAVGFGGSCCCSQVLAGNRGVGMVVGRLSRRRAGSEGPWS